MKMKALESSDSGSEESIKSPAKLTSNSSVVSGKGSTKNLSMKKGHGPQNPHGASYLGNPLYNDCLNEVTHARDKLAQIKIKAQEAAKKA